QGVEGGGGVAELLRPDVDRLARAAVCRGGEQDRLDEVLDGEQLVAVRAVAERVDPAPVANPVEEDLEDPEPLRPDERLRADQDDVEAAARELDAYVLGLD